jgi:hypothetical protein
MTDKQLIDKLLHDPTYEGGVQYWIQKHDAQTMALQRAQEALRIAHNALVWWQAGIEAKQPHNVLDEKTVSHALAGVKSALANKANIPSSPK